MKAEIKRNIKTVDAVFGVLCIDDISIAATLELPYKDNHPEVSSIPAGNYLCQRIISPHFGDVFKVMNVPNRQNILIHDGNYPTDTHGCIVVGEKMGNVNGSMQIINSRVGFKTLMDKLTKINEFNLTITEV